MCRIEGGHACFGNELIIVDGRTAHPDGANHGAVADAHTRADDRPAADHVDAIDGYQRDHMIPTGPKGSRGSARKALREITSKRPETSRSKVRAS